MSDHSRSNFSLRHKWSQYNIFFQFCFWRRAIVGRDQPDHTDVIGIWHAHRLSSLRRLSLFRIHRGVLSRYHLAQVHTFTLRFNINYWLASFNNCCFFPLHRQLPVCLYTSDWIVIKYFFSISSSSVLMVILPPSIVALLLVSCLLYHIKSDALRNRHDVG
jgi:hypothetical protein